MTKTFADRQICKVRGILRAVTRPASLSALAQQFKIEEQKIKSITEQLLRLDQVKGKVQQGGIFVPDSFTAMQEGAARSFFNQNRYIEYGMLSKIQVSRPKDFID